MDDDPEVIITAYRPVGTPASGVAADPSWVHRMPASWPAAGSPGAAVTDAAFAAVRASFAVDPPAAEYLRPVRVDRDGDTAVLVFRRRSDPRRFAIRIELPTGPEVADGGEEQGAAWQVPDPHAGLATSGPVDWAYGLKGWLEEELLTGAVRGRSHREGDLVVLELDDRGIDDVDRGYYLSRRTWGPVAGRAGSLDPGAVSPAAGVAEAGLPTADPIVAGRDGTLMSWVLARVTDISGGALLGRPSASRRAPRIPRWPPSWPSTSSRRTPATAWLNGCWPPSSVMPPTPESLLSRGSLRRPRVRGGQPIPPDRPGSASTSDARAPRLLPSPGLPKIEVDVPLRCAVHRSASAFIG